MPLIVHAPWRFGHRRVASQFGLIDLAPTVLDLLGVPQPDSFQGQSRRLLLEGATQTVESEPVFAEAMHCGGRRSRTGEPDIFRIVACRTPSWKYIRDDEGEREELFDLEDDPEERSNQAAEGSELLRHARKLVDEHLAFVSDEVRNLGGARGGRVGDGDEALRSRLAGLGYL